MKLRNFAALCMAAVLAFTAIPATTVNANEFSPSSGNLPGDVDVVADSGTNVGVTSGAGYNFDHLNKKIGKITFPTDVGTAFDYVIDPERLIEAASDSALNAIVSPSAMGVYFANTNASGTLAYSSSSDAIKVTNQCSYDIDLCVSAKVEAGENILPASTTSSIWTTSEEAISVTLNVGNSGAYIGADGVAAATQSVLTAVQTSQAVTIAGKTDNFVIVKTGSAQYLMNQDFEYKMIDNEADRVAWDTAEFYLTAACGNFDVTDELVTPRIEMTWSWYDSEEGKVPYSTWNEGTLWLGKDSTTGFESTPTLVEISRNKKDYVTLTSSEYSALDNGWVGIPWSQFDSKLNTPTKFYARITVGDLKYMYSYVIK